MSQSKPNSFRDTEAEARIRKEFMARYSVLDVIGVGVRYALTDNSPHLRVTLGVGQSDYTDYYVIPKSFGGIPVLEIEVQPMAVVAI